MREILNTYVLLVVLFLIITFFNCSQSEGLLAFTGAFLGALATIIAMVKTIKYSKEENIKTIEYSKEESLKNFKQAQLLNYKDRAYDLCDELIKLCSPTCIIKVMNDAGKYTDVQEGSMRRINIKNALELYKIDVDLTYKKFLRFGLDENFIKEFKTSEYITTLNDFIDKKINNMKDPQNPPIDFGIDTQLLQKYQKFLEDIRELPDIIIEKHPYSHEKENI